MKLLKEIISGITAGSFIGLTMSVIFSFKFGQGEFHMLSPDSYMGEIYHNNFDEPTIALFMLIVWSLIGIMFTLTGRIFRDTDWSITKMTAVHFCLTLFIFLPLAILAGWFPLQPMAILSIIVTFIIIYAIIWIIMYQQDKKMIDGINHKLGKRYY